MRDKLNPLRSMAGYVAVGRKDVGRYRIKKTSGAIMGLALLKTGLNGVSQILTPRLETPTAGAWIDRHRSPWIILWRRGMKAI
jgi:hypothetical protein